MIPCVFLSMFMCECLCVRIGAYRHTDEVRARLSLTQEKLINETANVKIIGITLETRPDCITADEVRCVCVCECAWKCVSVAICAHTYLHTHSN
jgi:radical SAM superfamily enzyme